MTDRHSRKRATMAANIETSTDRSIDEWIAQIDEAGVHGFGSIVDWLKTEHGFGHFQARLIAEAHRDRAR